MLKGDYLIQIQKNVNRARNPVEVAEQLLSVITALMTQLKSQTKKKPILKELIELRDACMQELAAGGED